MYGMYHYYAYIKGNAIFATNTITFALPREKQLLILKRIKKKKTYNIEKKTRPWDPLPSSRDVQACFVQ